MTPAPNPARTGNSAHFLPKLPPLALGLAGAFFGVAAWAERIEYTPSDDANSGILGTILIENDEGSGSGRRVIETQAGPVTVDYITTVNGPCLEYPGKQDALPAIECADIVTLVDWPEGVVPSETRLLVLENGTAEITLFLYVGG